jgi:hypothetical protein
MTGAIATDCFYRGPLKTHADVEHGHHWLVRLMEPTQARR